MFVRNIHAQRGFSLIELLVVIVVIGILVAMAMQSMDVVVDDVRRVKTEREMEMLAKAITGDPGITQGRNRCDFGYVGDIGAFPPNLQVLYQNTLGHSTWDGPYLPPEFAQDSTGFKIDEWGKPYSYSGGITLNSTGSGATISKKIADAVNDYIVNTLSGVVTDGAGSVPGSNYRDSVEIIITFPNGGGGTASKTIHPNTAGSFTFDSLPVGLHPLNVIYVPNADTLRRYTTILPRHKSSPLSRYVFSDGYFTSTTGGGGTGCDSSGALILRPNGDGSITDLSTSGCSNNWECVDETTADGDATRVRRPSGSWATDVYALGDPPSTDCSITSVTVYARARRSNTQGWIRPTVYTHSIEYNKSSQGLSPAYDDYSEQWTVNPSTGTDWTWTEITNLQAGIRIRGQNWNFPAYCTQVWVEVQYAP